MVVPVVTWLGGTGDWGDATKWSPGRVPGAGDFAVINAGTSTLSFAAVVNGLSLDGGALAGTGNLTLSGGSTWTAGAQTGTGTTQFNGNLNISGDNNKFIGGVRVINTAGTTAWGGNTFGSNSANLILNSGSGGTINNTGTWNDTNAFAAYIGGGIAFNNGGTYNKQGNTVTTLNGPFNNSATGTVNVNAGTLSLTGGGTSTGSFAMDSGSTMQFGGGTHNLNGVITTGTGRIRISNADVFLSGTTTHAGETLLERGSFIVNDNFNTATFNQSGGHLAGRGTITIAGDATWSGGKQVNLGTTRFNGNLAITGNGDKYIEGYRVVNTAGVTTWGGNTAHSSNVIRGDGTTVIINTGVWNDTNTFDNLIANLNFNNAGTYNKQGNTVTTIVGGSFNNTGTVNVNAGMLYNISNFANAGVINVDAGAIFGVNGTTFGNTETGVIGGNGSVFAQTTALSNSGDINPGNSIGNLTIDGDLRQALTGTLNFELTSLASFDLLTVTDDVTLSGEIAVWNLGYTPIIGDSFKVMTFDDRAGTTFNSLSVNGFGAGVAFNVLYNPRDVTLQVTAVPEAQTWVMLLAGLGLVGFAVRRRNVLVAQGLPVPA